MRSALRVLSVIALSLAPVACGGGDDGDTLNEQQATQAFGAMQSAVESVNTEIGDDTGSIDLSASCAGGGSVDASGTWTTDQAFSLDLDFSSCSANNVTIDGGVSYAGTATGSGGTVTIDGRLTFSGAVSGTCNIDLTITISTSSFRVRGAICGFNVDETYSG